VPWHAAAAFACWLLVSETALVAHRPPAAAQDASAPAWWVAPSAVVVLRATTAQLPELSQPAVTWAVPSNAIPLVDELHAPAAVQSDVATAREPVNGGTDPVRSDSMTARMWSPPAVTLLVVIAHSAASDAQTPLAVASVALEGAFWVLVAAAEPEPVTWIPHGPADSTQVDDARATETLAGPVGFPPTAGIAEEVSRASRSSSPAPPPALATETVVVLTRPAQPSGQSSWALLWVEPDRPGNIVGPFGLGTPLTVLVAAVALELIAQPDSLPLQKPSEDDVLFAVSPTPMVAPKLALVATQPGPLQAAWPSDQLMVAGASVTGRVATSAASVAVRRACLAASAAAAAAASSSSLAPGRAAALASRAASCSACAAWTACCSAVVFCRSAMTSATTWPVPAVALVRAWQLFALRQPPVEVEPPVGGPRAPDAPFIAAGPSLPCAVLRALPVHVPAEPSQSSVADDIVQLEAPGTVGAPEFAFDPGAVGAGRVAGWSCAGPPSCGCCAGACSPVVPEVTVALAVDRSATSGAITFASGPDEAPELVTAWHTPPETPSHDPSECEPRGSGETTGSVAVAALVTLPVHAASPAHVIAAPAAEAADGPAGSRAAFTCCPSAARASAAPGPEEALDAERASQPPVAPVQDAVPAEVRGVPLATAPSQAVVLVRTEPEQVVPAAHTTLALDDDVDDGPAVGCPATGRPVFGSVTTKSGALDAAELVSPEHPPPLTVHSAVADVPRACGDTPVSRALVDDAAVPPHSPMPPPHSTEAVAFDTLTGPETAAARRSEDGSRSATVVSVAVAQPPPAPRAVQDEEPVLLRTPATSPDAEPEVVLHPRPVQDAVAQSTRAPASLPALSSRPAEGPVRPEASRHCCDRGAESAAASLT
jgi:hypothetical protein